MRQPCRVQEVPVIVMCNYCTVPNLDGVAPQTMPVVGADGVVFFTRDGRKGADWTQLKRKVITALRALVKARRPSTFGGGTDDDDMEPHVHVSKDGDILLVDVGSDAEADQLANDLMALGDAVHRTNEGVMPEFYEEVHIFVEAKAPANSLTDVTLQVLQEMKGDVVLDAEALEFAQNEAVFAAENFARRETQYADDALKLLVTHSRVFDDLDKRFAPTTGAAANVLQFLEKWKMRLKNYPGEVRNAFSNDLPDVDTAVNNISMFTTAPEPKKHQAMEALFDAVDAGVKHAESMCLPCQLTALDRRDAGGSGVRTIEWDASPDSDEECLLDEHPLLPLIKQAKQVASKVKTKWLVPSAFAAFLKTSPPLHAFLLATIQDEFAQLVEDAKELADLEAGRMKLIVGSVGGVVKRNCVVDVPHLVQLGSEECSQLRVSAIKLSTNDTVRLVVMDGPTMRSRQASLPDVWAAAHEDQASLARYRMAHAQFRAAQLSNDNALAQQIRNRIIELQVDEVVADHAMIRQNLHDKVDDNSQLDELSGPWFDRQGYLACLKWFDDLLTQTKDEARERLSRHFETIAGLHTKAKEETIAGLHTKAKEELYKQENDLNITVSTCDAMHSGDFQNRLVELNKALERLQRVPDISVLTSQVAHTLSTLKNTGSAVSLAANATSQHIAWLESTFCDDDAREDHGIALPFLAAAAERSRPHIEKTATDALHEYEDANKAFDAATEDLVLCQCDTSVDQKRRDVATFLAENTRPYAVAVDISNSNVTLLLKYSDAVTAKKLRPLLQHGDLATCAQLPDLLTKLDRTDTTDEFPLVTAVAAVLQPDRHDEPVDSLDDYLSRAKYGLDHLDDALAPTLIVPTKAQIPKPVVELITQIVKDQFQTFVAERSAAWNEAKSELVADATSGDTELANRHKGLPSDNNGMSNACLSVLVDGYKRAQKQDPPEADGEQLAADVNTAVHAGAPLRAIVTWVGKCMNKQEKVFLDEITDNKYEPGKAYVAYAFYDKSYSSANNVTAARFLRDAASKAANMCPRVDDFSATVEAEIARRVAIAKSVNEKLDASDDTVDDTFPKQTWREFWIAPVEAYDEWTGKAPPNAQVPAFFQHVFPDMGKDKHKHEQDMYNELLGTLKGAPPSVYMYAFTQAKNWLETARAASGSMGGGSRQRAQASRRTNWNGAIPHVSQASAPESIARLPERQPKKPATSSLLEAGGSGPATRTRGRRSAEPHSLRGKPKSSLAGAVRRAVTLLVMEHKRISAAECCNRLLAGKFARGTRREDTAVISAESDRAALCRLAKELCGPLCR